MVVQTIQKWHSWNSTQNKNCHHLIIFKCKSKVFHLRLYLTRIFSGVLILNFTWISICFLEIKLSLLTNRSCMFKSWDKQQKSFLLTNEYTVKLSKIRGDQFSWMVNSLDIFGDGCLGVRCNVNWKKIYISLLMFIRRMLFCEWDQQNSRKLTPANHNNFRVIWVDFMDK